MDAINVGDCSFKSMKIKTLTKSALLILALALSFGALSQEVAKDLVLVLDNSGSMKKNDPNFLTTKAVAEFINNLKGDTRVAVLIFDKVVKFAVPLTVVDGDSRDTILKSLEQIDYRGQLTDSPAAVERAIYDLKVNGRPDVEKSIIFMTDGIVDTGNKAIDAEKTRWLREDLAGDAAELNIRIFAVAFTDNADFLLIQSLARRTDGEYYRAMTPSDLPLAFAQINTILETPKVIEPEPAPPPPPHIVDESIEETSIDEAVMDADDAAEFERVTGFSIEELENIPDGQAIITRPGEEATGKEDMMAIALLAGGAIALILLIVIIVMLIRRRGAKSAPEQQPSADYVPQGYLNDINKITSEPSYELSVKPAMLGRVAGKDREHLEYIVIAQSTIGRQHALIEYKDYSYWVTDQSSVNGTFVNGVRITGETRLKHGDLIKLHKYEFEFAVPDLEDSGKTVFSETTDKTVIATSDALSDSMAGVAAAAVVEPDISAAFEEPETMEAKVDDFDFGGADDEADGSDMFTVDADPADAAAGMDLADGGAIAADAVEPELDEAAEDPFADNDAGDATALFADELLDDAPSAEPGLEPKIEGFGEELPDAPSDEVEEPQLNADADVSALIEEGVAETRSTDAQEVADSVEDELPTATADVDALSDEQVAETPSSAVQDSAEALDEQEEDEFDNFFSDDDAEALAESELDDALPGDDSKVEEEEIPATALLSDTELATEDDVASKETAIFQAAEIPQTSEAADDAPALDADEGISADDEIDAAAVAAEDSDLSEAPVDEAIALSSQEETPAEDEIETSATALIDPEDDDMTLAPANEVTDLVAEDERSEAGEMENAATALFDPEDADLTVAPVDEPTDLVAQEESAAADVENAATALFDPEDADLTVAPVDEATDLVVEEEISAADDMENAATALFNPEEANLTEAPPVDAATAVFADDESLAADDLSSIETAVFPEPVVGDDDDDDDDDASDKTMLFRDDDEEESAPAQADSDLDDADAIEAKLAQAVAILDSGPEEPESDVGSSDGFHERATMMNEPDDDPSDITMSDFIDGSAIESSESETREVPSPSAPMPAAASQDDATVMVFADDEGGPASADAFISTTVFEADKHPPPSASEAPTREVPQAPKSAEPSLDDFVDSGTFDPEDSDATVLTLDEMNEPPAAEEDDPDRTVLPDEVPDKAATGGPPEVDQDDKTVFYQEDDPK